MPTSAPRPAARRLALALALLAAGCQCDGGHLTPVEGGYTVAPARLDFGAALEGSAVARALTVTSGSRLPQTLEVSTRPPFSAPDLVQLGAGEEAKVEVVFDAGAVEVSGVLHLGPADAGVDVPLRAEGVRPLPCVPTRECVDSSYSLALRACLEVPAPEGAECEPADRCQERGRCRAGLCLGVARSCDDNDACTLDACSSAVGCVNTPRVCPRPANPCHVATCSPTRGCGEANAPNLVTLCGPADCSHFSVCLEGSCTTLPTPLGAPCGVQVACVPAGTCQEPTPGTRECVRPDAGDWVPDWVAPVPALPGPEAPVLLSLGTAVVFPACGPALLPVPDAGADAGALDGGGAGDAGLDGGPSDDGGASWCGLLSYTGTGFLRFAAPFDDGQPRRLVHVAGRGVLLQGPGGLAYHALADGTELARLPRAPPLDGVAVLADGGVLLLDGDGGLALWAPDGGLGRLLDTAATTLALDERGQVWLLEPAGRLTRLAFGADGGLDSVQVELDAGATGLTAAGGAALAAPAAVVAPADGGLLLPLGLDPAWAGGRVERGGALQTAAEAFLFSRRCPTPAVACADAEAALWLSDFELATGALTGEVQVATADPASRLVLAALLDLQPPEVAVAAVTVVGFDGGARAGLQVLAAGQRTLVCPFPPRSTDVLGAVVTDLALVVLARRPDGGVALESYGLGVAPVHRGGWAAPFGEAGSRRAR